MSKTFMCLCAACYRSDNIILITSCVYKGKGEELAVSCNCLLASANLLEQTQRASGPREQTQRASGPRKQTQRASGPREQTQRASGSRDRLRGHQGPEGISAQGTDPEGIRADSEGVRGQCT